MDDADVLAFARALAKANQHTDPEGYAELVLKKYLEEPQQLNLK